ncbi:MAG TPA: NIPSNAP family protein [Nitrososphaerales archaeon]|nr:NIPSNAP family protein [Nitrososphaerales archaeon]
MEYQLREYDMNPGELDVFVQEWKAKIVPLRTKFGFSVVGAWFSHEENKFIWILGWAGPPGSFRKADQEYSQSPGRRAVDPNPARHIAHIRETMMSSALE